MKDAIKVGIVGIGRRGSHMLENSISKMDDVCIKYLCDLNEEKIEKGQQILKKYGKPQAIATTVYEDILKDDEIDAVLLFTNWNGRTEQAKKSMLAGKYTAIEVGCAENLDECYELVKIYEETGIPLMMLENICYGKRELAAFNMIKKGVFGEVVHLTGGYGHHLNKEELFAEMCGEEKKDRISHYRLGHYINNNCENYPTHELGPISKWLDINRGNRMLTLSSFASKSRALKEFAKETFGKDNYYANIDYKQGDIVTTIITCENGETISLTLDTTLPRINYSRYISVRGTKGMLSEDFKAIYLEGMEEKCFNNEEEFFLKYEHPLHKEIREAELKEKRLKNAFGAHANGVDWMIIRAFVDSVKNGTNTPIDAYDTATLLAIGPLSKLSIEKGGAPIDVPDFTNGKYKNREPIIRSKYCLNDIVSDDSYSMYEHLNKKALDINNNENIKTIDE